MTPAAAAVEVGAAAGWLAAQRAKIRIKAGGKRRGDGHAADPVGLRPGEGIGLDPCGCLTVDLILEYLEVFRSHDFIAGLKACVNNVADRNQAPVYVVFRDASA